MAYFVPIFVAMATRVNQG